MFSSLSLMQLMFRAAFSIVIPLRYNIRGHQRGRTRAGKRVEYRIDAPAEESIMRKSMFRDVCYLWNLSLFSVRIGSSPACIPLFSPSIIKIDPTSPNLERMATPPITPKK